MQNEPPKKWGGKREGVGRKPHELPAHFIKVRMSKAEFDSLMLKLPRDTKERGFLLYLIFVQGRKDLV